jgi:hypothetical protein
MTRTILQEIVMAEKKALIVLAPAADIGCHCPALEKFMKKGALFTDYVNGDLAEAETLGETAPRLRPEDITAESQKERPICIVDLGSADAAALDAALADILDSIDRKTVVAVSARNGLAFYGTGINSKAGSLQRSCHARDILPTLAYIADFPITNACTGAILYQALKSPNLKLEEIGKLKEAIVRMEGALARDNREPWDKHDCA